MAAERQLTVRLREYQVWLCIAAEWLCIAAEVSRSGPRMGWSGRAPALPARQAGKGPCLIGMEACTGAHHLSRKLQALGHDARLMPTNYVRPYSKGDKNDYRDAEAIAEAVQRPTMKFVATKTADQLDLQALHRVWCSRRNSFGHVAFRTHWNGAWCITAKLAADVRMGSKARITAVQRQGQVHPNQRTATPPGPP